MDSTAALSITGIVMSVAGVVLGVVNHKRVRSHCCGRNLVLSIDVESTTPKIEALRPAATPRVSAPAPPEYLESAVPEKLPEGRRSSLSDGEIPTDAPPHFVLE